MHPRFPTTEELRQELQSAAEKDRTSFEAYVIKSLWPDKFAKLQTFPGVELERFNVDDVSPLDAAWSSDALFPAGKKLRTDEGEYPGGIGGAGGSPRVGLTGGGQPQVSEARGLASPRLASTDIAIGGTGEATLDEETWAGHRESFSFDHPDPFGFAPEPGNAEPASGPTEPLTPLGLFPHEDPFRWDAHSRLGPISPSNVEQVDRRQWENDSPGHSPRASPPESPKLPFGFSVSQHLLGNQPGPSDDTAGAHVAGSPPAGRKGGARVAATWLETTAPRPSKLQVRSSKGHARAEAVQLSRPLTRAQKRRSSEEKHQAAGLSGQFASLLGEHQPGNEGLTREDYEDRLNDLAEVDTLIREPGDSPTGAMDWVAAVISREIWGSAEGVFDSGAPAVGTSSVREFRTCPWT